MNTKNNRLKSKTFEKETEEFQLVKHKKRPFKAKEDGKINLKSKRFWQERYEDEGEDLERFIR